MRMAFASSPSTFMLACLHKESCNACHDNSSQNGVTPSRKLLQNIVQPDCGLQLAIPFMCLACPSYMCIFMNCRLNYARQLAISSMQQQPIVMTLAAAVTGAVVALVISKYTLVHPYLLADNRQACCIIYNDVCAALCCPALPCPAMSCCPGLTCPASMEVLLWSCCTVPCVLAAELLQRHSKLAQQADTQQ